MIKGTVFDIKEMTVHDGPGSRVTVFLKGCPLRCQWCHNPEGLSATPQLMIKETMCGHCGLCGRECEHDECQPFGRCIHACPKGLVSISGTEYTPDALAARLSKYADFLNSVGGGVTFSGGEPLLQAEFVTEVTQILHQGGLHVAVDTCGTPLTPAGERLMETADLFLLDIKMTTEEDYKRYTGGSLAATIAFLDRLESLEKDVWIRHVVVPGINDIEEDILRLAELIKGYTCIKKVELLPYHRMGEHKYEATDMQFTAYTVPAQEDMDAYRRLFDC